MTPLDRNVIKDYLDENTTEVKGSITTAKQEILAKVKESAESGSSSGGVQTFTEDGTFTVPAGVTKILITACGGGAGGGGAIASDEAGAGGNGGSCIIREPYTVIPNSKINIVIGLGGAAGTSSSSSNSNPKSGGSGGTTVIGSLVSLPGGVAQVYATTPNTEDRNVGAGIGGKGARTSSNSSQCRYAGDGENGVRGCGGTGNGYGARDAYTSDKVRIIV